MVASAPEDRSGALVGGKYRLVRLLGRGGMGAVYEAENTWTRRRVATKLMRAEYARDQEALRRFMQEAQAASQLSHPNVVDVLDLGLEPSDGSLYMVQELLEGEDLRARLRATGRLEAREALDLLVPVVGALAAAHERGVVHRDIKPENIFLSRDPTGRAVPKLIDFGVSKVLDPAMAGAQTGAGTALGTPRYMAPEQVRGEPDVDARTDVWSVGVVLYELLDGKNPFDAPTAFGAANRVLTERPAPLAPSVPRGLVQVIERALAADKADRFAHARALLEALLALDEAAGLAERHASAIVRRDRAPSAAPQPVVFELMSQLGSATEPTLPASAAQSPPARAPAPRWPIALAATVVLALAGTGLWLARRHAPPPAPAIARPAPAEQKLTAPSPSPSPAPPVIEAHRPPKAARPTRAAHPSPTAKTLEEGTNRAPIVE